MSTENDDVVGRRVSLWYVFYLCRIEEVWSIIECGGYRECCCIWDFYLLTESSNKEILLNKNFMILDEEGRIRLVVV